MVDGTLYLFICIAVLRVHGERALYRKEIHVLRVRWGYLASADRWVFVPKRGLAVADPELVLGRLLSCSRGCERCYGVSDERTKLWLDL